MHAPDIRNLLLRILDFVPYVIGVIAIVYVIISSP